MQQATAYDLENRKRSIAREGSFALASGFIFWAYPNRSLRQLCTLLAHVEHTTQAAARQGIVALPTFARHDAQDVTFTSVPLHLTPESEPRKLPCASIVDSVVTAPVFGVPLGAPSGYTTPVRYCSVRHDTNAAASSKPSSRQTALKGPPPTEPSKRIAVPV